jgi:hypothetical protein
MRKSSEVSADGAEDTNLARIMDAIGLKKQQ